MRFVWFQLKKKGAVGTGRTQQIEQCQEEICTKCTNCFFLPGLAVLWSSLILWIATMHKKPHGDMSCAAQFPLAKCRFLGNVALQNPIFLSQKEREIQKLFRKHKTLEQCVQCDVLSQEPTQTPCSSSQAVKKLL